MPDTQATLQRLQATALPLPELYRLLEEIYASTSFMADELADKYPDPAALGAALAAQLARPGALFIVAENANGELSGFVAIEPRQAARLRHTAELHMGVAPHARGQGLGQHLLQAALTAMRAEGIIELLYLMVRADNAAAVSLYRRNGFAALATLAGDTRIDGRYYDGVLMRYAVAESPFQTL